MLKVPLRNIAHARSGDKGMSANVGVIAYTAVGYDFIKEQLTAEKVMLFFQPLGISGIQRYDLPNLGALNFVLEGVLAGGGSRSLRYDSQGKALGQALLEYIVEVPEDALPQMMRKEE
jgi:hypothetical protein